MNTNSTREQLTECQVQIYYCTFLRILLVIDWMTDIRAYLGYIMQINWLFGQFLSIAWLRRSEEMEEEEEEKELQNKWTNDEGLLIAAN